MLFAVPVSAATVVGSLQGGNGRGHHWVLGVSIIAGLMYGYLADLQLPQDWYHDDRMTTDPWCIVGWRLSAMCTFKCAHL